MSYNPLIFLFEIIREEKEYHKQLSGTLNMMKNSSEILKWILICPKWKEAHNNYAFCYTNAHISKDIDIYLSIFGYIYIYIYSDQKTLKATNRLQIILLFTYNHHFTLFLMYYIFRFKSNIPLCYFGK